MLRTEVKIAYSQAQGSFNELQPLILYIEDAMMTAADVQISERVRWISADFRKLKGLQEEVNGFYNGMV